MLALLNRLVRRGESAPATPRPRAAFEPLENRRLCSVSALPAVQVGSALPAVQLPAVQHPAQTNIIAILIGL